MCAVLKAMLGTNGGFMQKRSSRLVVTENQHFSTWMAAFHIDVLIVVARARDSFV
jgi:hypothetical protein